MKKIIGMKGCVCVHGCACVCMYFFVCYVTDVSHGSRGVGLKQQLPGVSAGAILITHKPPQRPSH